MHIVNYKTLRGEMLVGPCTIARIKHNQRSSTFHGAYLQENVDCLAATASHTNKDLYDCGTLPIGNLRRMSFAPLICTYVITSTVTGSVYVGSSEDFYNRWAKHTRLMRRGLHTNIRLQDECDRYGIDTLTIEVLKTFDSTRGLIAEEITASNAYDPALLLNFYIGKKIRKGWCTALNTGKGRGARPTKKARGPQMKVRWFDLEAA